ncbi:sulfite exporter TauE/SafE family protein [Neorickettsia helminthoeca str. Oregon]|uniref:Probable membrane transporter protein n=1 Tax=Neorickettsia helminthoeca str. Oregon TaxID=1286528 RepID=X5HLC8_9RICK|nr:sulfite exporter TauE/SafE family protein [Neorickettsia helminthoeca]AHX11185.1 sulfite exporter TauE/SafE family protein [Neorickettsia helminthoeca str. Oregon]
MQIYFPIAEISIPIYVVMVVGLISGVMAGLFGIGGNFITIPTLIFMNIAPTVALSSAINQTVASSFASFLNQLKQKNVDLSIAFYLFLSGACGTLLGSFLLMYLQEKGNIDIVIFLIYIGMLASMGSIISVDSVCKLFAMRLAKTTYHESPSKESVAGKCSRFVNKLPLRRYFHSAKTEISIVALFIVGLIVGLILSLSGVGGGFLLVPTLIYLFNLPTRMAIGTSVFQSVLVSASATFLHAITLHTVDVLLGFFLSLGAIFGVALGARLNLTLHPLILRLLLSAVMFAGVFRLLCALFLTPENLYSFFTLK